MSPHVTRNELTNADTLQVAAFLFREAELVGIESRNESFAVALAYQGFTTLLAGFTEFDEVDLRRIRDCASALSSCSQIPKILRNRVANALLEIHVGEEVECFLAVQMITAAVRSMEISRRIQDGKWGQVA